MKLWLLKFHVTLFQLWDLICKQYSSLVSVYQRQKLSVCDQKPGSRILQHVHQTVFRICRIKRLVCCTGFDHTHWRDCHVFAAWDQDGNNIFPADSLGCNVFSKSVADLVQLFISVFSVFIYNSSMVRNGLHQFIKHIRNCFVSVVFTFCMVEFCNLIHSTLGNHGDFGNKFCLQRGTHSRFIGIQDSVNKGLAVHVAAVFCSEHISVVVLSYLDQQRHFCHIQGKVMASGNSVSDWIIVA